MDLTEVQNNNIQDFFEQSRLNSLILPIQNVLNKCYDEQSLFRFDQDKNALQIPSQNCASKAEEDYLFNQTHEDRQQQLPSLRIDNPIELLFKDLQNSEQQLLLQHDNNEIKDYSTGREQIHSSVNNQRQISTDDLEKVISFLVEYPSNSLSYLSEAVGRRFPLAQDLNVIKVLIDKFSKLKKTKEELIKYCMRKAFKFILQLPSNHHILGNQKKYSFSKCKNKYLKRVSQQKSMNAKFLQQIFSEKDFKRDYSIFLQHFQQIMLQDNQKKIGYLAYMLTNNKEGKVKNAQMVRRLPWTKQILERVLKISKDLLKHADPTTAQ